MMWHKSLNTLTTELAGVVIVRLASWSPWDHPGDGWRLGDVVLFGSLEFLHWKSSLSFKPAFNLLLHSQSFTNSRFLLSFEWMVLRGSNLVMSTFVQTGTGTSRNTHFYCVFYSVVSIFLQISVKQGLCSYWFRIAGHVMTY